MLTITPEDIRDAIQRQLTSEEHSLKQYVIDSIRRGKKYLSLKDENGRVSLVIDNQNYQVEMVTMKYLHDSLNDACERVNKLRQELHEWVTAPVVITGISVQIERVPSSG